MILPPDSEQVRASTAAGEDAQMIQALIRHASGERGGYTPHDAPMPLFPLRSSRAMVRTDDHLNGTLFVRELLNCLR